MKTSYLFITIISIVSLIAVACGTTAVPSPSPTKAASSPSPTKAVPSPSPTIAVSSPSPTKPAIPTLQKPTEPAKPAWQDRWDSTVRAAKAEGSLLLYTTANPSAVQAVKEAFKKKYGIDTDVIVGRGGELVQRIVTERQAGLYLGDIMICGATTQLITAKPHDMLDSLDPVLITPDVTDPGMWRGKKIPFLDRAHLTLGFIAEAASGLAVNTDSVKVEEIKSYRDLLSPKWKGKIVMDDPTVAGDAQDYTYFMQVIFGPEAGKEYLLSLVKQEPAVLRNHRLVVEWLARNKHSIAIGADTQTINEFLLAGAPIKHITKVSEARRVGIGGGCMSLLKRAAHPNAATVFINWFLGKEGQSIFVKEYGSPSARIDAETTGIDPAFIPQEGENLILGTGEEWIAGVPARQQITKQIFEPLLQ